MLEICSGTNTIHFEKCNILLCTKVKKNNVNSIKHSINRSYFVKRCKGGTSNAHFWKTVFEMFEPK